MSAPPVQPEPLSSVDRLTEGTRRTTTTFDCFDGLRAIAAFAVLVHHASFATGDMNNGRFAHYFTHLDIGVAIFFLISGFLLYRPFVARVFSERVEPPVREFFLRRAARIFPAYWVALAVIIVVFRLDRAIPDGVLGYAQHFFLVHIYDRRHASLGISQAWTLAVEITFYAFLPLYAAVLRRACAHRSNEARLRIELGALVVLYAAGVAFRAFCYWGPHGLVHTIGIYWLPANLDLFALGMALAVLSAGADAGVTPRRLTDALGRASVLWWAVAAFFFWVVLTRLHIPVGIQNGPPTHLKGHANQACYGLVALFLLIPAVFGTGRGGPVRGFLRWRPVAYFGVVSYGVYLWHQAWIGKVVEWQHEPIFQANFFVTVLGATALAFTTAVLSWVLVERPCMRWAHRATRAGVREVPAPS